MRKLYILVIFVVIAIAAVSQKQYSNIPTIYINTINNVPVSSKTVYVKALISVVSSDTTEIVENDTIEIRGRGNSTWNFPKKPYRIKFAKKRNFMNLPAKAKNWVLLANHADKTLIRNAVAFKIGKMLDFEYVPPGKFADVVLNGQFLGNYMITDQMEVGGDRVEVDRQDTTMHTVPDITGGYLLEIDGFAAQEPVWFTTSKGVKITIKYPDEDEINVNQKQYITTFTDQFEKTLFDNNFTSPTIGYRSMIDTVSFIDWYIASELTGNPDCFWSTYIYKKRNDNRFFYGPMWDYDIAFNNDNRLGDALNKRMLTYAFQNKTWIERQYKDNWFKEKVNKRWLELKDKGLLPAIQQYIDSLTTSIDESQKLNFQKWPVLNRRVYNEQFLFNTYSEGIDFLKRYVNDRADFLTNSFAKDEDDIPGNDFKAEDFYYMILNKQTKNAIDITGQSTDQNAKLMLWDPIEGRLSQNWIIKPLSGSRYQIINRLSGLAATSGGRAKNLLQVTPDTTQTSQMWKIIPENAGTAFRIDNVNSGYTADCSGGSYTNGTAVIEYDIKTSGSDNQYWYIQKVERIIAGISPDKTNLTFDIYPNPVKDMLYIKTDQLPDEKTTIDVISIYGQTLYRTTLNAQGTAINMSGYSKGLYLIKIKIGGDKEVVRKIVVSD